MFLLMSQASREGCYILRRAITNQPVQHCLHDPKRFCCFSAWRASRVMFNLQAAGYLREHGATEVGVLTCSYQSKIFVQLISTACVAHCHPTALQVRTDCRGPDQGLVQQSGAGRGFHKARGAVGHGVVAVLRQCPLQAHTASPVPFRHQRNQ